MNENAPALCQQPGAMAQVDLEGRDPNMTKDSHQADAGGTR